MTKDLQETWSDLILWLEGHKGFENHLAWRDVPGKGRGLFTTRRMKPDERLLLIPASAMINPLTLARDGHLPEHIFPQATSITRPSKKARAETVQRMNTTQLLTLHMARLRASPGPSKYAAYLATLPRSFRPWHPLTWLYPLRQVEDGEQAAWNDLFEKAPRVARQKLLEVKRRYEDDIDVIKEAQHDGPAYGHLASISTEDLLWAWLIVNTRTVSIPLGLPSPTELYNHTLVPLLDLINHTSNSALSIPKPRQVPNPGTMVNKRALSSGSSHLVPGKIAFELIAPSRGMEEDEEVFFSYGAHDAATLWSEYGFVESPAGAGATRWETMVFGGMDVGHWVEEVWKSLKPGGRQEKLDVLEAIGCWNHNALYTQPLPPNPSHGLMMTLRVFHLGTAGYDKLPAISRGEVTFISPDNEASVHSSLDGICSKVVTESELGLQALSQIIGCELPERKDAANMLEMMFEEQLWLARKIRERIRNGEDLS
ncbi:hypothetical protein BCR39DRAFT_551372 [Naematelia encephala]|uniref:SET domain-containing protein n=1 Tax=Naematelia encephala TaxID=71784 RepID=A0A1Y2AKV2_9TREE|nr:hypothetical protein BCR39DRAFT_551372 [Naematelia encephala]